MSFLRVHVLSSFSHTPQLSFKELHIVCHHTWPRREDKFRNLRRSELMCGCPLAQDVPIPALMGAIEIGNDMFFVGKMNPRDQSSVCSAHHALPYDVEAMICSNVSETALEARSCALAYWCARFAGPEWHCCACAPRTTHDCTTELYEPRPTCLALVKLFLVAERMGSIVPGNVIDASRPRM